MIYFWLFVRFFLVGLFAVGGGLATLPFLYEMSEDTGWFTTSDISDMIAISEATPGPLGVNMSTYVGFITGGIPGGIIGPLGLVAPSVIVIILVAIFLNKFKESKTVQNVFYGLRPASAALIASAGLSILKIAFIGTTFNAAVFTTKTFWISIAMAVATYIAMKKLKLPVIAYIAIAAVLGVVFKLNVV